MKNLLQILSVSPQARHKRLLHQILNYFNIIFNEIHSKLEISIRRMNIPRRYEDLKNDLFTFDFSINIYRRTTHELK